MIVTRTIYGAQVQTALAIGVDHIQEEYTTLNEAINDAVLNPHVPSVITRGMEYAAPYNHETDTREHRMQVVVIGNGGHANEIRGNNSIPTNVAREKYATDAVLRNMIPFVVVPAVSDISVEKRKRYRLRRTVLINNVLYVAYYGRHINSADLSAESVLATTVNGNTQFSTFIPSINNMRPSDVPTTAALTGAYVSVTAPHNLTFTEEDTQDLLNACSIMYGDPDQAMISELAICTCVDKPVIQRYPANGTQTPTSVNGSSIKESVCTQISIYSSMKPIDIESLNAGTSIVIELGISEPLLGVKG